MAGLKSIGALLCVLALGACGGSGRAGLAGQATGGAAVSASSASSSVVASSSSSSEASASSSSSSIASSVSSSVASSAASSIPAGPALYFFAGAAGGGGNLDGTGQAALFSSMKAMVADASGNLVVLENSLDFNKYMLRKVTPAGVVTTTTADASIMSLGGGSPMTIDSSGTIYYTDLYGHLIRKRTSAGTITTIAGTGASGSANGTGTAASFNYPGSIVRDGSGNLYVADTSNYVIRKITAAGVVTTYAGTMGGQRNQSIAVDGGVGSGRFYSVGPMALDASGNLYVLDWNLVRKVSTSGVISTVAGGTSGSVDGTGTGAGFFAPRSLTRAPSGDLYIGESGKVRKVTPAGVVTTEAGTGFIDGDGPVGNVKLGSIVALVVDSSGVIYAADETAYAIRKIESGMVSTLAGPLRTTEGLVNGAGNVARFSTPKGMAVDASGNMFVIDSGSHSIRKITPDGTVSTYAGGPYNGTANGDRSVAKFTGPTDLAFDAAGNLYVVDSGNHQIRKITPAGEVSTFAGSGSMGTANGTGTAASFKSPRSVRVDSTGNLFVTDGMNRVIRKITPAGVVSTFAGTMGMTGNVDGTGVAARFESLYGLTIDTADNLYVVDWSNCNIRKITPAGVVTTLAGGGFGYYLDGTGTGAYFNQPTAAAVDIAGNVFVADSLGMIRKITPGGVVTTVLGTNTVSGTVAGPSSTATLSRPNGVIILPDGQLAISVNHAIVKTVGVAF